MSNIICPKCGKANPDSASFCNNCGTPLVPTIGCPHCHQPIPANSVFCPKCGKMVRDDMAAGQSAPTNAWGTPAQQPGEAGDGTPDAPKPNNRKRNIIISIAIALFVLLFIVNRCFFSGNSADGSTDNDSIAATDSTAEDATVIFSRALQDNNQTSDGAIAVYALKVSDDSQTDGPERIVGITCLSNPMSRSFFKIYTVSRNNGSDWALDNAPVIRYLNQRAITFDNGALIVDSNIVPQVAKIDGKTYFLFAYLDMPQSVGENSVGRVTFGLYNVDSKELKTYNYDGPVKTRDYGRQYVYAKLVGESTSPEARFVQSQAASVGIIYIPTPEELEAEKQKEEDEKLSGADMSVEKWKKDNGDKLTSLDAGDGVTLSATTYDTPIFNFDDAKVKKENDRYIAILAKDGHVYGFNKQSRKYFVVYAGDRAADIGFASGNNDETKLNIKVASGRIVYNLSSGKAQKE